LSDEAPVLFTEETEPTATTTTDIFGEPIGGTQPAAETNVAPVTEPVEEEPVEVEEEEVLEEDPDEEPEEKGPNPITNGFKKTWNWLCNIVNDDRD
jgi:hypothetical protein